MDLQVSCYAGGRGEEVPRALTIGGRRVRIAEVLDRWLAPDHRYFKVLGEDGATYLVRHDVETWKWELIVYESPP